ncbi:uncharacterized protein LOC119689579 [Teleopsis dalmanni]|uniref:uncharacterized protein LOC119689579 n=1 Tax=Teleopsis dalmanni TaxID=139649 RepID=UPI0018CF299F|nr:uncharacterized protein LOC119689579 [Teleopsis dalmanni]
MGRRRKYRKKAKLEPEKESETETSRKKACFDEGISESSRLGTYTGERIIKQPAIITSKYGDENTEGDFMLRTAENETTCEQNIVLIQAQGVQHYTENELNHTAKYCDGSSVQRITAEDKEKSIDSKQHFIMQQTQVRESMSADESIYTVRNYRASPESLITEKEHELQSTEVQRENFREQLQDCQQIIQNVSNDIMAYHNISSGYGGAHQQIVVEVQSFKQQVEGSQEITEPPNTTKYHAIVSKVTKKNEDAHPSYDFEIMLRNFDQRVQGCQVTDADDFIAKYYATCEKLEQKSGEELSFKLELELLGFGKQSYACEEVNENKSFNTVDYDESSIIEDKKESEKEHKQQSSEVQTQQTQKESFSSSGQAQHFLEVNENMSEGHTQPVENLALVVITDDVISMEGDN